MDYRKLVIRLILVATALRLVVAGVTELSNDEVYYWTYALKLQSNYFDHPPMIALLVRLCTGNLLFQQELFVRLGAILCAAINTWLIYLIGARVNNERTGWIAACLYTASFYGSVLAGLIMLPDAPQMVFWLYGVLLMMKIFKATGSRHNRNRRLALFGLVAGLCILSKVHGIFLWSGFFLYMMLYDRSLLRNPFFYLSILITACVVSPILLWNIDNDFVTYRYHNTRVSFFSAVQWDGFLRQILGEIGYNNPVNIFLIISALLALRHHKLTNERFQQRALLAVSIPMVLSVWFLALFRDTLPHWTGPAYSLLLLLAAGRLNARTNGVQRTPTVVKVAVALPLMILLLLPFAIRYLPYQMGKKEELSLGAGDLLLDMSGWESFAEDFRQIAKEDQHSGRMKGPVTILADYWFPSAHLDYYVARPAGFYFLAIGSLNNIHHYAWVNRSRAPLTRGQDAYYIAVSNYYDPPPPAMVAAFQKMDAPEMIGQYRRRLRVRNFVIYRLHNYQGGIPDDGIIP